MRIIKQLGLATLAAAVYACAPADQPDTRFQERVFGETSRDYFCSMEELRTIDMGKDRLRGHVARGKSSGSYGTLISIQLEDIDGDGDPDIVYATQYEISSIENRIGECGLE